MPGLNATLCPCRRRLATAILKRTINATRLIYFLYQLLQIALSPAVALYLLYRGIRDRSYFAGLASGWGFFPLLFKRRAPDAIWFHAVSVGEVLVGGGIDPPAARGASRSAGCIVSTTTLAGPRLGGSEDCDGVAEGVFFAPLDYRSMVRRVLRRLRPAAGGGARNRNLAESVPRIEARGRVADDRQRPHFRSRPASLPALAPDFFGTCCAGPTRFWRRARRTPGVL